MSADMTNTKLVEALIFAAPEPITADEIGALISNTTPAETKMAVDHLNQEYELHDRAFRIISGAGGFRFATRSEFGPWVRRLVVGSGRLRFSRAALESVSIIAYRQPISRSEIESVRGVDVGGVLRLLLERKLINVAGRSTKPGKALLYGTTDNFLRYFGLSSIEDLPAPEELIGKSASGTDVKAEEQEELELDQEMSSTDRDQQPSETGIRK